MSPEGVGATEVRAFLGVGSSLEPEENIRRALALLAETPGIEVTGISTFYRTPPLPAPGSPPASVEGDPDFLNGVLEVRTTLSPEELMRCLTRIEETLGRVRSENKYAPRTMDLDLLVMVPMEGGGGHPPEDKRTDPGVHPDLRERPFVAIPLLELAPELLVPPKAQPLATIAGLFTEDWGRAEVAFTQRLRTKHLDPEG